LKMYCAHKTPSITDSMSYKTKVVNLEFLSTKNSYKLTAIFCNYTFSITYITVIY